MNSQLGVENQLQFRLSLIGVGFVTEMQRSPQAHFTLFAIFTGHPNSSLQVWSGHFCAGALTGTDTAYWYHTNTDTPLRINYDTDMPDSHQY